MRTHWAGATPLAAVEQSRHLKPPDGVDRRNRMARQRRPVPYDEALRFMEERAAAIRDGAALECVWLLEHPPLVHCRHERQRPPSCSIHSNFPFIEAGRGGRYTYHGPGQRVGYVMLDLEKRGKDIRRFVHSPGRLDDRHAGRAWS